MAKRQTPTEKALAKKLSPRPDTDFAVRVANLGPGKVYNVSRFGPDGRGARPINKETVEQDPRFYWIKEVPQIASDNINSYLFALEKLGKKTPKNVTLIEAAFGAQKRRSPKKASVKKASPKTKKTSVKKASPKTKKISVKKASPKATKKISVKKASPKENPKKLSPAKESRPPDGGYQVRVDGDKAKISPRTANLRATRTKQGLIFGDQ